MTISGANFLIQRLPDQRAKDPPDSRPTESVNSRSEAQVDEGYRRTAQKPVPTTICKFDFSYKNTNFSQSSLFFASVPSATNHHTMLGRLASVLDSFSIVCSKASFDPLKANYLVANHLRTSPLQKSTLISLSTMIAKMMTEFAMSQFLFMSLDSSDRVI